MLVSTAKNEFETNSSDLVSENFGIGDVSMVIEILRKHMYTFKIRTLVQEYLSNGRDSVREAGTNRPIEVVLPNRLEQTFKVRDFGTGISPELMLKVFIQYGASTKRTTNSLTGGFGIGAKSAFSYTDSFVINTVSNGRKRSYTAHVGVNSQGRLDQMSDEPTDEPNGTEIQIAVKYEDLEEFRRAVCRAIYFWKDEERPKVLGQTMPDPRKPNDMIGALERTSGVEVPDYVDWQFNSYSQDKKQPIAVIDGIIYPIANLKDSVPSLKTLTDLVKSKIILHVGNGLLSMVASRETIAIDIEGNTVKNLTAICDQALIDVQAYIEKQFEGAKSLMEFIKIYQDLTKDFNLGHMTLKYEGFEISGNGSYGNPVAIHHEELFKVVKVTKKHQYGSRGYRRGRKSKVQAMKSEDTKILTRMPIDWVGKCFWRTTETVNDNRRLSKWIEAHNEAYVFTPIPGVGHMLKVKALFDYLEITRFNLLPYDPIVREARSKSERDKSKLRFYTYHDGKNAVDIDPTPDEMELDDPSDNKQKYIYCEADETSKYEGISDIARWIGRNTNYIFASTCAGNVKKIQGNKRFIHMDTWIKEFKTESEHLAYYKRQKATNRNLVELLKQSTKYLKDTLILDMIKEYDWDDVKALPDILKDKVDLKAVANFEMRDVAMRKLVKKKYPLIWLYMHKDKSKKGNYDHKPQNFLRTYLRG